MFSFGTFTVKDAFRFSVSDEGYRRIAEAFPYLPARKADVVQPLPMQWYLDQLGDA